MEFTYAIDRLYCSGPSQFSADARAVPSHWTLALESFRALLEPVRFTDLNSFAVLSNTPVHHGPYNLPSPPPETRRQGPYPSTRIPLPRTPVCRAAVDAIKFRSHLLAVGYSAENIVMITDDHAEHPSMRPTRQNIVRVAAVLASCADDLTTIVSCGRSTSS